MSLIVPQASAAPPAKPAPTPAKGSATPKAGTPQGSGKATPASPNEASDTTKDVYNDFLGQLPFTTDQQDFADAKYGKIAPLNPTTVVGESGAAIWSMNPYTAFASEDPNQAAPYEVNPSLWRQLKLLTISGLFKVSDQVYQVRGYDLSNMSIIEGTDSLIVIDPLISKETAAAALKLYYDHSEVDKPVKTVIFTHSHVDHFAGVLGVATEADILSGSVKIVAPEHFLEEAVSENVIAGNAMGRRAIYMYGALLLPGPRGQASAGLGLTNSLGRQTLMAPNDVILASEKNSEGLIDRIYGGLTFRFQLTPGTEAPAEMNLYIPQLHALCMAENLSSTFHNVLTLRGAKVRDPLVWSKYLQESIDKFVAPANSAAVVFNSHHWPKWGNGPILNFLSKQRDLYKYIHDQTLRLLNQGQTITEIAEELRLPDSLAKEWFNRGYYGTVNHNAKAVYQRYIGWFDGNPAHLYGHPPAEAGKRYVALIGGKEGPEGEAEVLRKLGAYYDAGDYRLVAEVASHVVFANPNNQAARDLEAAALEQLGYQAESGPWRNFFLMGAKDLREGKISLPPGSQVGIANDTVKSMGCDLLLDYFAIHLNGVRSAGPTHAYEFRFTDVPADQQRWRVTLDNAVINYKALASGAPAVDPTVTTTRLVLNDILAGRLTYAQAKAQNLLQVTGTQAGTVDALFGYIDVFDPWFNIVTP